jgi:hypothetical protein
VHQIEPIRSAYVVRIAVSVQVFGWLRSSR